MPPPPAWVRALLAIDRAVVRVAQAEARMRDELLWSFTAPERRGEVTAGIYARDGAYAPGGAIFEQGLRVWEERILARTDIPRAGSVLLGGAGGGREARVLCERGYRVVGFDPCAPLAAAADTVATRFPGSRVLRGSYEDLPAAARGEGALASLRTDGPFALVLLGWRSLSHVLAEEDRAALFVALDRLAPAAPIVASFHPGRPGNGAGRARAGLRRALAALGAPGSTPAGAAFIPSAGFAVALSREDMQRAASACGRTLALCETESEGIALFAPARTAPEA